MQNVAVVVTGHLFVYRLRFDAAHNTFDDVCRVLLIWWANIFDDNFVDDGEPEDASHGEAAASH
jgi:hypothetical protein